MYSSSGITGWSQAFFTVLVLWGINNVFIGYSSAVLEVNPIIYACSSFASCSLILLLLSGKGDLAKETLLSPYTWAYGVIILIGYIVTLKLFGLVTSTEGSLLQRTSVIAVLAISWMFFSRKPGKRALAGVSIILLGIYMVFMEIPAEIKFSVLILMICDGSAQALRVVLAEAHPQSNLAVKSGSLRTKLRVIAVVMLVSATIFLSMAYLTSLLLDYLAISVAVLPTPDDFGDKTSITMGLIAGAILVAPLRYFEFSCARLIKSENYLAVAALSPAATYFWESLAGLFPSSGMTVAEISTNDLIAGGLITFGGLYMAYARLRKEYNSSENSDIANFLENIGTKASIEKKWEAESERHRIADERRIREYRRTHPEYETEEEKALRLLKELKERDNNYKPRDWGNNNEIKKHNKKVEELRLKEALNKGKL